MLMSCAKQLETEHKGQFFCPEQAFPNALTPTERASLLGAEQGRCSFRLREGPWQRRELAGGGEPRQPMVPGLLPSTPEQPRSCLGCISPSQSHAWGSAGFQPYCAAASNSRGSSGRGRGAEEARQGQPCGRREAGRGLAEVTAGSSAASGRESF